MGSSLVALFEFEEDELGVRIQREEHFRFVPPKDLSKADSEK